MRKYRTTRQILLDYVEKNGAQTWDNLHSVVCIANGQPITRNEYGSGFLDQVSEHSSVCFPTRNEKRFLVRCNDGLYRIVSM